MIGRATLSGGPFDGMTMPIAVQRVTEADLNEDVATRTGRLEYMPGLTRLEPVRDRLTMRLGGWVTDHGQPTRPQVHDYALAGQAGEPHEFVFDHAGVTFL